MKLLYHKYDDNSYGYHFCVIIAENNEIKKSISSSYDRYDKILDFHSGEFLRNNNINQKQGLYGSVY